VLVEDVKIHGDWRWPNNDGIDPNGCNGFTIRGVTIECARALYLARSPFSLYFFAR
jgi:hypothetical protein